MPTYQYRCTECGHDLEVVQKFSDAALTECPNCHGQLRKVFNAVGVVFKGSGFYRTDSRAKEGAGTSPNGSDKGEGVAAKTDGKDGSKDGGKTDRPQSDGQKSDGASTTKTKEPVGTTTSDTAKNASGKAGRNSSTGSPTAR